MEYRGYIFRKTDRGYEFKNIEDERLFSANSIEDAKEQIDSHILEHTIYEVEAWGLTHFFQWLSDAVSFASKTGGVLRNEFNAI